MLSRLTGISSMTCSFSHSIKSFRKTVHKNRQTISIKARPKYYLVYPFRSDVVRGPHVPAVDCSHFGCEGRVYSCLRSIGPGTYFLLLENSPVLLGSSKENLQLFLGELRLSLLLDVSHSEVQGQVQIQVSFPARREIHDPRAADKLLTLAPYM